MGVFAGVSRIAVTLVAVVADELDRRRERAHRGSARSTAAFAPPKRFSGGPRRLIPTLSDFGNHVHRGPVPVGVVTDLPRRRDPQVKGLQ